jgi:hypothetical protein
MAQTSADSFTADLIIRRILDEDYTNADLAAALEQAYPFDHSIDSRCVWLSALLRQAIGPAGHVHQ